MGKKRFFKRRNLFLISFLAIAGIFSAGAFALKDNNSVVKQADAADTYRVNILTTSSVWLADGVSTIVNPGGGNVKFAKDSNFPNYSTNSSYSSVKIGNTTYAWQTYTWSNKNSVYANPMWVGRGTSATGSGNYNWFSTGINMKTQFQDNNWDNTIILSGTSLDPMNMTASQYGWYIKVTKHTGLDLTGREYELMVCDGTPSDPAAITGYTFSGWRTDSTLKTTYSGTHYVDVDVYAKYTPNTYAVTIAAGTGVSSVYLSTNINATSGSSSGTKFNMDATVYGFAVLRDHYVAPAGWTLVTGTTNKYRVGSKTVTTSGAAFGTQTATAEIYDITYKDLWDEDYSGDNEENLPDTHTYGTATPLVNGHKDDYTFAGWFTDRTGSGDPITSIGATEITGDITLYAKWTVDTYTVNYLPGDADSGEPSYTSETPAVGIPFTTARRGTMVKDGYVFTRWHGDDGNDYEIDTQYPSLSKNEVLNLTAVWEKETFTISYNKNGGTGTVASTVLTKNEAGTLATNSFTRTGYTYGGWATSSGGAAVYTSGQNLNASQVNALYDSGNRTLYAKWNEYQDFWISFDNGTHKTQLTKVSATTGSELYQLSTASQLTVQGGESVTFWRGPTADSAVAYTYVSDGLTADTTGDSNNIVVSASNTWTVRNYATSIDVYFKVFASGINKFYLGGKEGTISDATYGVYSGSTFFIEDQLTKNQGGGNMGSENCKIAVYFYDPVKESTSVHAWTTAFATKIKSSGGIDTYSITVPYYNGLTMQWGGAIALRFASNMAVSDLEAHGFDWCFKDSGDSNKKNGVNPGHFANNLQNGIQATYWWGESLPGGYNINGNYFMYSDGGLASGTGLYVDPSNAAGNWDMSATGYGLYIRLYGIVGGDGSAERWIGPMTKVPGASSLYEIEVPQVDGVDVEWSSAIIVYNTSASWPADNLKQSQYFLFSSTNKNNHHFTFTGQRTSEWYSEATVDNLYNDASRAEAWGNNFINTYVKCSGSGSITTDNWANAKADYNAASKAARGLITNASSSGATNLSQAVYRYDYTIHKYGTSAHEDFASRVSSGNFTFGSIKPFTPFDLLINDENYLSTLIIVIASSVSLLSITALSVLMVKKHKRKEQ